ncbi:MAG: metallopeptidase family protein [Chloroflexota bacterium]|nr:metallopeptidase family protein [Chloroflexota bacterium]
MIEIDRERFESIVRDTIEALPATFGERISNLEFAVEDWALPQDYARTGSPGGSVILGVYRGIPLPKRNSGYNMTLPDRVVIFQQPLQRISRDEADLAERIAHVVRHEIAHYFGISDDRLREIEAY